MTRSNKILLSVVALGAAIAAFYFFVLAPKRDEVAKRCFEDRILLGVGTSAVSPPWN